MTEGDMLGKALGDIRERMANLQAEYERVAAELAKLRLAERSLAAIVEGAPLEEAAGSYHEIGRRPGEGRLPGPRGAGRGSRGPRANSAKGRLKALLEGAGPQGLSQAEITRRLPDVAPNTLSAYLSVLVSSGEAIRRGDFISAVPAASGAAPAAEAGEEDEAEDGPADAQA